MKVLHFALVVLCAAGCATATPELEAPQGEMAVGANAPAAEVARKRVAEFSTEAYDRINENGFHAVQDAPLSTFSVDVDTASYSNVRRFVMGERLPPKDAVRIEELINYFSYSYPDPDDDTPFAVHTEVSAAPWNPAHRLVHIGIQGKRIGQAQLPPRNLVFLVDVSGSMSDGNKLPLLKTALSKLTRTLGAKDRISLVVYAGATGLVLPPTSGEHQDRILEALDRLQAGGPTNGGEGLELAYEVAQQHFVPGGVNRVLLATDGDFNVGTTAQGDLSRAIEEKRKTGVYLTVLGFGMGNYKDSTLEHLADSGNGNYAYIDDEREANKVLVDEGGATLVTIAKDVKIQIEWNPQRVGAYRLIGYENRVLADRDFNDDAKDAGDIGAGHSVTALYELAQLGSEQARSEVDPLKYQNKAPVVSAGSPDLLTVKLRYKKPDSDTSRLIERSLRDDDSREPSQAFRFAAAVAAYGMLLRDSEYKGQSSYGLVEQLAQGALGSDPGGHRRGFIDLVQRTERLGGG
jgi:Ca-activated chloride channel family protein